MKPIQPKKNSLLVVGCLTALFLYACDTNEPKPEEFPKKPEVTLEFSELDQPIVLPMSIENSDKEEAIDLRGYIGFANSLTWYSPFFNVPDEVIINNEPIVSLNASTTTNTEVVVYQWTIVVGQESAVFAFQVNESEDNYYFEIFANQNEQGMFKLLDGFESKNVFRQGALNWYEQEVDGDVFLAYTWEETSDGTLAMSYENFDNLLFFTIDPDGNGTIESRLDDQINAEYTWNGNGGTVTYFNSDGEITETYSWTI